MNVYQRLKTTISPSLSELLIRVEKNKNEISSIIFDKEKIAKFNNEYSIFSEKNFEYILKAIDEILFDDGYISLCCAMYLFMKEYFPLSELKPPEDGTLISEFALMPPLIANIIDFCNDAKIRGVKKEILSKTLIIITYFF